MKGPSWKSGLRPIVLMKIRKFLHRGIHRKMLLDKSLSVLPLKTPSASVEKSVIQIFLPDRLFATLTCAKSHRTDSHHNTNVHHHTSLHQRRRHFLTILTAMYRIGSPLDQSSHPGRWLSLFAQWLLQNTAHRKKKKLSVIHYFICF